MKTENVTIIDNIKVVDKPSSGFTVGISNRRFIREANFSASSSGNAWKPISMVRTNITLMYLMLLKKK